MANMQAEKFRRVVFDILKELYCKEK
ncbi:hypothetical protein LL318_04175 [Serratia ureilytica]|nr:hypothetical protein [Serratia ureilytica]